ncbi:8-oxo-dGTP diphosphatase [Pseudomonas psychrotolerans]|nr:8-oxo-dGTP diphosphatase [Pseudomonas psychrotolerans]
MTTTLHVAAAVLLNEQQQLLLVRKRGTSAFMQPGGKIDRGEQPLDALVRELYEELGLVIDPSDASFLGNYLAPAANEPGFMVDCALYRVAMKPGDEAIPAAEIEGDGVGFGSGALRIGVGAADAGGNHSAGER